MSMIAVSNGRKYLSWAGGLHEVDDIEQATKFKNYNSCQNAFELLPQRYKDAGYSPFVDGETFTEAQVEEEDETIFNGLYEKVKDLEETVAILKKQAKIASIKLAECDKRIEDILHAIELQKLNAVDGYNTYKRLHDLRVTRRKYKDRIFLANSLIGAVKGPILDGTLSKQIAGLDERKYRVKYETEYFKI